MFAAPCWPLIIDVVMFGTCAFKCEVSCGELFDWETSYAFT